MGKKQPVARKKYAHDSWKRNTKEACIGALSNVSMYVLRRELRKYHTFETENSIFLPCFLHIKDNTIIWKTT